MAIQNDWAINYTTKQINHTSGSTVYTANELYSWLMNTFDELNDLDDTIPMEASTPSEYSLINGWFITSASYPYLKGGAITDTTNNDLWVNIYTIGTIVAGSQLYVQQNGSVIPSFWPNGHIDILVRIKQNNNLIDAGKLTVFCREFGNRYDHFEANVSTGGRQPIPLATSTDPDNLTTSATVSGWSDVTVNFGNVSKNLNNGYGSTTYNVVVNAGGRTVSQTYERLKFITRRIETALLNSVQGQLYQYALSAYTPEKTAPFGTFAGGKFFGARGVWIENYNASDAKNFQLIDANGTTQIPPNVVAIQVTSVLSGDRVAVYRLSAGNIDKNEYLTSGTNSSGTMLINVQQNIKSDTPTTGIVVVNDTRYSVSAWSGKTFYLSTVLTSTYTNGTGAFVPFIEQQASTTLAQTTITFNVEVPVRIVVRKKGIKPFTVDNTITNVGLSVAAIRTIDNIVT